MPTDCDALDRLYPISRNELSNQWILTRDSDLVPEEWRRYALNGWFLGCHQSTVVCELNASDGQPLGWVVAPLLYFGSDGRGCIPRDSLALPIGPRASALEVEQALYGRDATGLSDGSGLEGIWTAVVFTAANGVSERCHRVYVSPTNSVVYSGEKRVIATSPNLIPELVRNRVLSRAFDPLESNRFYGFGLTAFEGIERLLPNHCIDLNSFEVIRHWPRSRLEPFERGADGARAIVDQGRRIVEALSQGFDPFHVFLSAGRDSRAILAIAKRAVETGKTLYLSTTYGTDLESRVDLQAARQIARLAGLPHSARRKVEPPSGDNMRTFARIGEARAGSVLAWPSQKPDRSLEGGFKLAGMAGELGRAFYWSQTKGGSMRLEASVLADKLRQPEHSVVLEAIDRWIEGLPQVAKDNVCLAFDFAYLEQRLGCWAAPVRLVTTTGGPARSYSPMTSAVCIETMLRLPEAYRAEGVLQRDMVAEGWPELLRVPFNEPAGLLKLESLALRVGRKAARFARR